MFEGYDDLTLARWMAQTLGQFEGKAWRLSHPLVGTYRLAASVAHGRSLSIGRLATFPSTYGKSECCGAPVLPLLTRDVKETGLGCLQCGATMVPFANIPETARKSLDEWANEYADAHAVAHWDEKKQKLARNYNDDLEEAAEKAEDLLAEAGFDIVPVLLESFPAVLWEDQDECLEVRPEDIPVD